MVRELSGHLHKVHDLRFLLRFVDGRGDESEEQIGADDENDREEGDGEEHGEERPLGVDVVDGIVREETSSDGLERQTQRRVGPHRAAEEQVPRVDEADGDDGIEGDDDEHELRRERERPNQREGAVRDDLGDGEDEIIHEHRR